MSYIRLDQLLKFILQLIEVNNLQFNHTLIRTVYCEKHNKKNTLTDLHQRKILTCIMYFLFDKL